MSIEGIPAGKNNATVVIIYVKVHTGHISGINMAREFARETSDQPLMLINSIEVQGLFGVTNAVINLNQEKRVTIIHAPNGFGKTTIFELINSLFSGDISLLVRLKFKRIIINLMRKDGCHDERKLIFNKDESGILTVELMAGSVQLSSSKIETSVSRNPKKVIPIIEKNIKNIYSTNYDFIIPSSALSSNIEFGEMELRRIRNALNHNKELSEKDAHLLNYIYSISKTFGREEENFINIFKNLTKTKIIGSQRLSHRIKDNKTSNTDSSGEDGRAGQEMTISTVEDYSSEIKERIARAKRAYNLICQSIDKSFPDRMIEVFSERNELYSKTSLKKKMGEVEEKRAWLISLGLLEPELDTTEQSRKRADITNPSLRKVLGVFAEDTMNKMSVLDGLAKKIDILLKILNSRYRNIEVKTNEENGIFAISKMGTSIKKENIPPIRWSSGEQHLLVINYDLIFDTDPGCLVLVDEPEISQDITWQHDMIDELQKVAIAGDFYFLVATHSPQIVGDHLDMLLNFGE